MDEGEKCFDSTDVDRVWVGESAGDLQHLLLHLWGSRKKTKGMWKVSICGRGGETGLRECGRPASSEWMDAGVQVGVQLLRWGTGYLNDHRPGEYGIVSVSSNRRSVVACGGKDHFDIADQQ